MSTPRRYLRSSGVFALLPQSPKIHYPIDPDQLPLDSSYNTENFELLNDAVQDLEVNMQKLNGIHQAISQGFNESFASLLYGLSITMWCVDFPSTPSKSLEQKLEMSKNLDNSINDLEMRLELAKQQNEILKTKVANKAKVNALRAKSTNGVVNGASNSKFGLKPRQVRPQQPLVQSRRPQRPQQSLVQRPASRPPVQRVTKPFVSNIPTSRRGPNLNQPARYLNDYLNKRNTNSNSFRLRMDQPATNTRPPFR